ncbi:unnamed protein product [Parnassius mnemosyne]|uniref:Enhancer of mRNA-decapping protein 4 C-terminal domain-containing protein n=1 Tax=Parnassius mnemosyne TaxID=213953 RepID=A0AAV1MBB5_9NEOP
MDYAKKPARLFFSDEQFCWTNFNLEISECVYCIVLAPITVYRYLEEAIMNLDTSNPVTREHLPVVVRELQKQITAYLAANPGHALTRQFRMLLMAADSLVKSAV